MGQKVTIQELKAYRQNIENAGTLGKKIAGCY